MTGPPAAGGVDGTGEQILRRLDARLATAACAVWCATAAGVWGGAATAWGVALAVGASGAAAAVVAWRAGARPGACSRTAAGTLAAVLLASCGFAAATAVRAHAVETNPVTGLYGRWVHMTVRLDGDPRRIGGVGQGHSGSPRVLVHGELRTLRTGGRDHAATGAVVVFAPADGWIGLLPGQQVGFYGRPAAPDRRDLTVAAIRARGSPNTVSDPSLLQRVASGVRSRFAALCARVLGAREAGLVRGLVLGDVSGMPPQTDQQFTAAGLTHLTAVSGSNFALVCGLVLLVVRPLGPRPAAVLTALAVVGFVVLVRPSPSVLRAAVMGLIGLLALVTGRRRQALPALGAAVLALLAWKPALSVDAGFAMSVAATAALVVLAPVWVDGLRERGRPSVLVQAVVVASVADLVTIPVVAAISGGVSTVAVLANVLAAPAVAPATVVGAVAAALAGVWPWAAELVVASAGPPAWWLVHVAEWCAGLPWARIAVPDGAAGAVLTAAAIVGVCGWYASRRFRWCAVMATVAAEAVWLPAHWTGFG
ncbi:ComEC/Rec2 family competence protein [Tomitella fengzijianii]|uniref:ComEC/Rec2 family competence protein n=1 Tax=Tomitella fengzijianii TaxID=2597660 RepID=A0A516X5S7_9ACTN|nr:ComEC/Rec2 family competence protein [Tomitella fengzijianii]QDQ98031.1 ComEC/Rec2 family competence protein [Tomitella fengzijianii]